MNPPAALGSLSRSSTVSRVPNSTLAWPNLEGQNGENAVPHDHHRARGTVAGLLSGLLPAQRPTQAQDQPVTTAAATFHSIGRTRPTGLALRGKPVGWPCAVTDSVPESSPPLAGRVAIVNGWQNGEGKPPDPITL